MTRLRLPLIIVAAACLLFYLLQLSAPAPNTEQVVKPAIAVTTQVVELKDTALKVTSQGTVEPRTETPLIARVAGEVVWVAPTLRSGGRFTEGDTLLKIDSADYELAHQQATAEQQRAQAEFTFAESELRRITSLRDRELASDTQQQQAQRNRDIAKATLLRADSALSQAALELERCTLRAPYSGRVRSASVAIGQFVQRGTPLASLYATDHLEVRLPVADSQLAFLSPALSQGGVVPDLAAPSVRLRANFAGREREWRGVVARTEGEIDSRSRMVHVVTQVTSATDPTVAELPIGLFVEADIAGITVDAVAAIPRSSLLEGNRVLVVDNNNRLRFRDVQVLRISGDSALIQQGLSNGDLLCLAPLPTPIDGMAVVPVPLAE